MSDRWVLYLVLVVLGIVVGMYLVVGIVSWIFKALLVIFFVFFVFIALRVWEFLHRRKGVSR